MFLKQHCTRALSCGKLAGNCEADDSAANYLFDHYISYLSKLLELYWTNRMSKIRLASLTSREAMRLLTSALEKLEMAEELSARRGQGH
jgi:hypothetical protein